MLYHLARLVHSIAHRFGYWNNVSVWVDEGTPQFIQLTCRFCDACTDWQSIRLSDDEDVESTPPPLHLVKK